MRNYHTPVLLNEVLEYINLKPNGVYIDCTVGGGGHSEAIISKEPSIRLYCFDQDKEAILYSKNRLSQYPNISFYNENFNNFRNRLALEKISKVDGILMDLGVSNHQIADTKRGFSFMYDDKLDMRMNKENKLTAFDIINKYSLDELQDIFHNFGEERYSKKIARNIIEQRKIKEINTTLELAKIINESIPEKDPKNITKSQARIFQSIRIVVNNELNVLSYTLKEAISALKLFGRLLVISWHSLEDRIVKEYFKESASSCICPKEIPECRCEHIKKINILTKKPITPSIAEIKINSNSRSAKLRIIEKIS